MSSKTNSWIEGATDNAMAIAGTGNTLQKEQTVTLSNNAKIVGGDNLELGLNSTLNQLSENSQLGGYRVGDYSSLAITSLDEATGKLLETWAGVLGQNSNNFMTLAAGRDANKPLADKTLEVTAEGEANPLMAFIKSKTGKVSIGALAAAVLFYAIFGRKHE